MSHPVIQGQVGGLVAFFLFSHSYWVAIIIPIAELIFFRGVALAHQPEKRHQRFLFKKALSFLQISEKITALAVLAVLAVGPSPLLLDAWLMIVPWLNGDTLELPTSSEYPSYIEIMGIFPAYMGL